MSTDEYVPDEQDFIDSWACAHVTPHDMTAEEAKDAARAFLARVRRDAAREALGALADAYADDPDISEPEYEREAFVILAARHYRDTHYPEETP